MDTKLHQRSSPYRKWHRPVHTVSPRHSQTPNRGSETYGCSLKKSVHRWAPTVLTRVVEGPALLLILTGSWTRGPEQFATRGVGVTPPRSCSWSFTSYCPPVTCAVKMNSGGTSVGREPRKPNALRSRT